MIAKAIADDLNHFHTSILRGKLLFMKCDVSVTSVSRFVLVPVMPWLGLCGVQYLSINITGQD